MGWLLNSLVAFTALVDASALPDGSGAPPWMQQIQKRQGGTTMLRFGCPQLVIDRLDPLVNPGVVGSPHVHQIVGGNAFKPNMTTSDVSGVASCTTCSPSQDFSNYWTANMYFKARNGTYKRVPQLGAALQFSDTFSNTMKDGILVYYVSAQPGSITAFKPGFRMLMGDPAMRSRPDTTLKRQNCYRCYTGPNFGGDVSAPCQDATLDTEAFPKAACKGGIRSNILFPTCWDGVNLDSPDHKAHVAYPAGTPPNFLALGGACPSTHPVRIPQLMLEVVWDTTGFNNAADWPTDGSQPFVLSTGDPTGLGQHADYVFGWKDNALQKAMDVSNCFGPACGSQASQPVATAKQCVVKPIVNEDVNGWITTLPGMPMS